MQAEAKVLVHVGQGRIPQGRISTQLHSDSVGTSASLEHRLIPMARMLAVVERSSGACAHLLVLQHKTNHRRTSAWSSRPTARMNASANLPGCHRRSFGRSTSACGTGDGQSPQRKHAMRPVLLQKCIRAQMRKVPCSAPSHMYVNLRCKLRQKYSCMWGRDGFPKAGYQRNYTLTAWARQQALNTD